ncbi:LysE family transporter [Paenibacillus solani]|uniref:Lysine transporter LysE n=1 Tax=Paenibacillus solani TaxID=1705565 RepID=A0A0M1P6E7_9BACL|nr:LysE family transporter [Paenibacillus solani]KOR89624.1 lysine transporter LysE [Paenibacillus solani]
MFIIPLLTYAIVSSFTPGPNNIISMTNARSQGVRKTMRFIGGVAAGCMVIMLLWSYFNLVLKPFIPKINFMMNILGCLYMIYLAIKIMRSKPQDAERRDVALCTFTFGFIFQFMNPKVILYGITAISSFVMPISTSPIQLLFYSLGLTIIGICANMTWALFGSLFKNWLSRYERPFNLVMGLLLIYSAVSIFTAN